MRTHPAPHPQQQTCARTHVAIVAGGCTRLKRCKNLLNMKQLKHRRRETKARVHLHIQQNRLYTNRSSSVVQTLQRLHHRRKALASSLETLLYNTVWAQIALPNKVEGAKCRVTPMPERRRRQRDEG